VVSEAHALGVSSAAAWELWPETDVLLGIGSRLEMPYMRWTGMMRYIECPEPPPRLIRIDIDADEMTRLVPEIGIVADAAAGANALSDALARRGAAGKRGRARIADAKAAARRKIESVQPEIAYLDAIREVLPADGFFVEELCQAGFASYFGFPVLAPRTYVTAGFQGTLGFGFPTALGVKVANPDAAVVSITGDGGFLFGVQELATAAQHGLAVVTLVFNNNSYGNVRRDQKRLFQGRMIGAELCNPDFVRLAESFGVRACRVDSPDALKPALGEALDSNAPALIEIAVEADSETSPWPFIHPAPPGG
jgi:acetolactate synthase-1/2/3 large subunit